MRLVLLAVGRMKQGPERALLDRYVERAGALARPVGLTGFAMRELPESAARLPADRRLQEAQALRLELPAGCSTIVLDERGETMSSTTFATLIGTARDAGRPALAMVVGGPDGLDPVLRETADRTIAYGTATFPHQLVRIMAAEQIYRAMTILAGHPYHRP